MTCLQDFEIQSVADGESNDALNAHVATCSRCRARVDTRRREVAALLAAAGEPSGPGGAGRSEISPAFEARMRQSISEGRPSRGATTLRADDRRPSRRRAWISASLAAAAAAIVI